MPRPLDIAEPTPLLGGLSPRQFMRRHWQKRPLLVRQALPGVAAPLTRAELFALAARDEVESRLVRQDGARWSLRRGPLPRRALPPVARPGWTLLVQGLDLHLPAAHALLSRFRFAPAARLDDLMLSWASAGGGVGPHVDSYDVFLLQVQGRRRWRIAPPGDAALRPGLPLKILARFEPTEDWVLEPGDLLYLPPGWAHEGVAVGECMTASIGFRAPERGGVGREVVGRLVDAAADGGRRARLYRDPAQPATDAPGRVPPALQRFAAQAAAELLRDGAALQAALGEWLSEPSAAARFVPGEAATSGLGVRLDAGSRMLYDDTHVFLNGESWRASGRDAALMRRLADRGGLGARELARASAAARDLIAQWLADGWLHAAGDDDE
ncbi:MAG TPA: cupin domain-containing protein [Methylibium sp.]|nr:cupin domain-containing protein [Methylibium sp.]